MKKILRTSAKVFSVLFVINGQTKICFPQSRLILNGAFANISGGAFLVVDNPSANAIARNSGHILSEGENNRVKWNIGTTTGSYTVPFGFSNTDYLPVSFTKTAGAGAGSFVFSTYHTPTWKNSLYLPSGVLHVNSSIGAVDNSSHVIDRFWMIDAGNYSTKPDLTNLLLTYTDAEHAVASNTITETNLQTQRYNSTSNKWGDYIPASADVAALNNVNASFISGTELYKWWTLADKSEPLPMTLISFKGKCDGKSNLLEWTTASEINNDYFSVERSADAYQWNEVSTVKGALNSTEVINYTAIDESAEAETNYYRLKQTDVNGRSTYSEIISVEGCKLSKNFNLFPNPADAYATLTMDEHQDKTAVDVYNSMGEMITSLTLTSEESEKRIDTSNLKDGIYFVSVLSGSDNKTEKLIVKH